MTPRIGFCWISRAEMPSSFEADERKDKGSEKPLLVSVCFGGQRLIVLNCEDLAEMRYDGRSQ